MNERTTRARTRWISAGSRLALHYGLVVTITMLAAITIVYLQTAGVMSKTTQREVHATMQKLKVQFEAGGTPAIRQEMARAMLDDEYFASDLFVLTDASGHKLAGNIDGLALSHEPLELGHQHQVRRAGTPIQAYLVVHRLPDGNLLGIGQNLHDELAVQSLVTRASAIAIMVAAVMLVAGFFLIQQEIDGRVAPIREVLARVAGGALRQRVAQTQDNDEFAQLALDINRMLDQIERLMDGVRHVSDTIAHDLRTPLTRILLRLRVAAAEVPTGSTQGERLQVVMQDVENLTGLFDKLLQISESEAGARRQPFQRVDMCAIAADVLELYEAVAEQQSATLEHRPRDEAPAAGDPDLLAGCLANLVDNALKYGGRGVTVRVGTRCDAQRVLVTVRDDGPGVPSPARTRLGERFVRLDSKQPGHGLGLASVRAIVGLHGGQLRFEDLAPGLLVELQLPRAPA